MTRPSTKVIPYSLDLLFQQGALGKILIPEAKPNGGGNIGADKNDEERRESLSFYISIIAGFIVGFCGVCGAQSLKHHRGKLTFKSFII